MKFVHLIMVVLTLIGGLNWTLTGLMHVNLFVTFGGDGAITTLLYLFTTISTLYVVFPHFMKHLQPA
jgi:uncharacterized membrane protein YuzA (DUF378 family)